MSIELVILSNHVIFCHRLLLLLSIFSSIKVFSSGSALHIKWPKFWTSASASVLPMNIQGWLSKGSQRRIECFDLLAVQGALKGLLQHHNSKASLLQHSTFFMVQLSHQYMTTGKTIAFTIWNFVSKVMSLLFNMLSRFVIAFLPWGKFFFQGPISMSGSNCCFLTSTPVSQETNEMVWYPYLFKNFLQCVVIHSQRF